jgi:hypothetical protein
VPTIDVRPEDDILDERSNATAAHLDELMRESSEAVREHAIDTLNDAREHSKNPSAQDKDSPDFWFMHENGIETAKKSIAAGAKQGHSIKGLAQPAEPLYTFSGAVVKPGTEQPVPVTDPKAAASAQALSRADEQALLNKVHQNKAEEKKHHKISTGHKRIMTSEERLDAEKDVAKPEAKKKEPEEMTPEQRAAILEVATNDDISVATAGKEAKRVTEKPKNDDGGVIFTRH